jgi:release factor glutamine methyltransferase
MTDRVWTVAEILATTTEFLAKKDPSSPRLEAELLLGRVLKLNRVNLYVNFARNLTPEEISAYRELVRRRGGREPVAYILGHKEFYGLNLAVTPATLIPRPETEHLVDEALRLLRKGTQAEKKPTEGLDTTQNVDLGDLPPEATPSAETDEANDPEDTGDDSPNPDTAGASTGAKSVTGAGAGAIAENTPRVVQKAPATAQKPAREPVPVPGQEPSRLVADVGTGSGAIALALLSSLPNLRVVATDVNPKALAVAKENAKTLGLEGRVKFLEGHLAEPLAGNLFDLICANLPYIPDADLATLSPDVANFEPKLALKGGPDGLDLIAPLIASVKPLLKEGGHLLLEIWPDTVPKLNRLALDAGLLPLEPLLDYSKKPRIFVAKNQLRSGPIPS